MTFTMGSRTVQEITDYSGLALGRFRDVGAGSTNVAASVVDPSSNVARTDSESITVVARTADAEPNDSLGAAIPSRLRQQIQGTLGAGDSRDYFRFETTTAGTVVAVLRIAAAARPADFLVRFLTVDGQEIGRATPAGPSNQLRQAIGVGPGVIEVAAVGATGAAYPLEIRLEQAPVTIASVSPPAGPPGTVVTIAGSGFSIEPGRNVVLFGKVRGTVIAATQNQLQARVPAAALDGALEVIAENRRATGPQFVAGRQGARPIVGTLPVAPEAFRFNPVDGVTMVVNRLIVFVDPMLTPADMDTLTAAEHGRIVGTNQVVSSYVLEFAGIDTIRDLEAKRRAIAARPEVELVARVVAAERAATQIDALNYFRETESGARIRAHRPMERIALFEAIQAISSSIPSDQLQPVVFAIVDDGFHATTLLPEYERFDGSDIWTLYTADGPGGAYANVRQHDSRGGHGEAMMATAAALNNGRFSSGVLGSLYTPDTVNFHMRLFSIADDATENLVISQAFDAITEIAIAGDVDVVNMSFVSTGLDPSDTADAFRRVLPMLGGRTVVTTAAGNAGRYADRYYPGALQDEFSFLINVGGTAVDNNDGTNEFADTRALWDDDESTGQSIAQILSDWCLVSGVLGSNCGAAVTLAAPAEDWLVKGDGLSFTIGTSVAAPAVGSIAAILQAIRGAGALPLASDLIRDLLVDSALDISEKWDPGPMRRIDALAAVRFLLVPPTNQTVMVADREAPAAGGGTGHVVTMEIDPLTGQRPSPPRDRIVPLTLLRNGTQQRFVTPGSMAADPAGRWTYVVVTSTDASLGDGIAVINTQRHTVDDFIAFSGAALGRERARLARRP